MAETPESSNPPNLAALAVKIFISASSFKTPKRQFQESRFLRQVANGIVAFLGKIWTWLWFLDARHVGCRHKNISLGRPGWAPPSHPARIQPRIRPILASRHRIVQNIMLWFALSRVVARKSIISQETESDRREPSRSVTSFFVSRGRSPSPRRRASAPRTGGTAPPRVDFPQGRRIHGVNAAGSVDLDRGEAV